MSPLDLLGLTIAITAIVAALHHTGRRRWQRSIRELAGSWHMNYASRDQWRLTPRVASAFPIPGAADVRIVDVIYGSDRHTHRYVFTAEFTVGVVNRKRRLVRAAAFSEAREPAPGEEGSLVLAPATLPLHEQYAQFAPTNAPAPAAE